jgi:hypothetical protein
LTQYQEKGRREMKGIWLLLLAWLVAPLALAQPVTAWVDDATPAAATLASDGGDAWNWITANPAPFSGTRAHQSVLAAGEHQHYFYNATATLSVAVGDTLFAYVYLDPSNPPSEMMLQWYDGTWEHRAYWGANLIPWGTNGTVSRRSMGTLPATGQWVQLSVPAAQVGLEGRTLSGMAFTLYNGRATWDYAGKNSTAPPPPPPPTFDAFETAESTSPPNATVPVDALIAGNSANDVDVAIMPKGSGAFLTQIPDGTVGSGVKRGPFATDFQRARLYATDVASGYGATISGGANSIASGVYATVIGGFDNEASGHVSIVGGQSSTASGEGTPIALGYAAVASGDSGIALGHDPVASGTDSVAIGRQNVATRDNSVAIGWASVSDATQSMALGTNATTRGIHGAIALAGGQIAELGDAQTAIYMVKARTVNATPTQLTTDAAVPALSRGNVLALPDNASYAFTGRLIAKDLATGNSAAWKFEGMAKRGIGAGSVVQMSTVTLIAADLGTGTWTLGIFADGANGSLALQVGGQAGRTIQWVATVETTETTY